MPELRKNITTKFYITPDYFEQELLSTDGAAFGIEPLFRQSAYFRYHNRSPQFENLYFVGAGTHPGAGVPGVLNSAKATASLIPTATAGHHHVARGVLNDSGSVHV